MTFQNGLDASRLEAGTKEEPASSLSGPHFGFLGSIAWQKGLHVLIEAFNKLPPDVSLTIYGDDTRFPEYASAVKDLVRHPHVRFAGPLDYRHIGDALRQLDFLVVPSLWGETFCMVIQEAQAVGVPVIASNLGALNRIRDGEDGRLFEAGNSDDLARVMRDLVEHPEKRDFLAAKL
jgi:glycosyltransferase involved in cell wall biosynthesis